MKHVLLIYDCGCPDISSPIHPVIINCQTEREAQWVIKIGSKYSPLRQCVPSGATGIHTIDNLDIRWGPRYEMTISEFVNEIRGWRKYIRTKQNFVINSMKQKRAQTPQSPTGWPCMGLDQISDNPIYRLKNIDWEYNIDKNKGQTDVLLIYDCGCDSDGSPAPLPPVIVKCNNKREVQFVTKIANSYSPINQCYQLGAISIFTAKEIKCVLGNKYEMATIEFINEIRKWRRYMKHRKNSNNTNKPKHWPLSGAVKTKETIWQSNA